MFRLMFGVQTRVLHVELSREGGLSVTPGSWIDAELESEDTPDLDSDGPHPLGFRGATR